MPSQKEPTVLDAVQAYMDDDVNALVKSRYKGFFVLCIHSINGKKAKKPLSAFSTEESKRAAVVEQIDETCIAALPLETAKNADSIGKTLRRACGLSGPIMTMNTGTGNFMINFFDKEIKKATNVMPERREDAETALQAVVAVWLALVNDPTDDYFLHDNEDHCCGRRAPVMLATIYKSLRTLLANFTDADLKIPAATRRALLHSSEIMRKKWHKVLSMDSPYGKITWPVVEVTMPELIEPAVRVEGIRAKTQRKKKEKRAREDDDDDDEEDE